MKKIQTSIILLLLVIGIVSCKKTQNSSPATNGVTTDLAATISTGSLAANSSGLATNFNDIATNALLISQACGTTLTDSTTKSGNSNGITYNYFFKYTHALTCNTSNQNDHIIYDLSYNGHYESPSITSSDTGSSHFKISDFTPPEPNFVVNGIYKRGSKFTMKTGDKVSGTSDVEINVTDLNIVKSTKVVSGGSATIALTIIVPKGTSHYTAPLTFNGDGTATATINGTKYSINLVTGVVTNTVTQ